MNDIVGVEALPEELSVVDEGRGTELRIHIVAEIDLENVEIFIVEVVGALAVEATIHGLCEIEMRDCLETDFGEINIMLATVVVDLHKRNKTETRQSEGESEVKHMFHFTRRVDVAANEVAAGIDLLYVNPVKTEGSLRDAGAINLRKLLEVVVMERH
jgi:hypothetical protein